jgi:hypothetical protein
MVGTFKAEWMSIADNRHSGQSSAVTYIENSIDKWHFKQDQSWNEVVQEWLKILWKENNLVWKSVDHLALGHSIVSQHFMEPDGSISNYIYIYIYKIRLV